MKRTWKEGPCKNYKVDKKNPPACVCSWSIDAHKKIKKILKAK